MADGRWLMAILFCPHKATIRHLLFAIRHPPSATMLLYLIRHGLATWSHWGGPDNERPLTPEGARLIEAEGAALACLGLQPAWILHSPLQRARQTAELIAEALNRSDQLRASELLRPGFDPNTLKQLLRQYPIVESLMLVGHAPDMGEVTRALTGGQVKFKEGAVACVQIEKPETDSQGVLLWLAVAEMLILLER
jgi:phosphohistidine phosphatase